MSSTSRGASKGFIMCVLWRMTEQYLKSPDTKWPLPHEAATRILRVAKEDMTDDAHLDDLFGGTTFREEDTETYWTQPKSLATFWKNNLVRRTKLKRLLQDAKSATGERGNLARSMSVAAMNLKVIVAEGRLAALYKYPDPCPEYIKKLVSSMRVGSAGLPSADLVVCNTPAPKKAKGGSKTKTKGKGKGKGWGAGEGAGGDEESSIASLSSKASRSTARSRSTRSYYEESESESESDMDDHPHPPPLPRLPLPPRPPHRQHLLSENACAAAGLLLQLHHSHSSLDDDLQMPHVQEPLYMGSLPDPSSKVVPEAWGAALSPFNMHIVTQGDVMVLSSSAAPSPLSTHTHNALANAFLLDMDVELETTAAAVAEGLLTLSPFAQGGSATARPLLQCGACSTSAPTSAFTSASSSAFAFASASAAGLWPGAYLAGGLRVGTGGAGAGAGGSGGQHYR